MAYNYSKLNPKGRAAFRTLRENKTTQTSEKRSSKIHARGGGDVRRQVTASGGPRQKTQAEIATFRAKRAALRESWKGTPNIRPTSTSTPSPTNLPGRRTVEVSSPSWFFGWKNVPTWVAQPQDTRKVSGNGTIKIYRDTEGGSWASSIGDTYHVHPDGSILVRRTGGKLQYYKNGFIPKGAYGVTVKEMPEKFL